MGPKILARSPNFETHPFPNSYGIFPIQDEAVQGTADLRSEEDLMREAKLEDLAMSVA